MPATYENIATVTITSPTSQYDFTNIPQTYTDLVIASQDIAAGGSTQGIFMRVGNGSVDTSNYSRVVIDTQPPSTIGSGRASSVGALDIGVIPTDRTITSLYHIMNYANTNVTKSILVQSGGYAYFRVSMGLWNSTSAINIVRLYPPSTAWSSGTTITLYGIKAA